MTVRVLKSKSVAQERSRKGCAKWETLLDVMAKHKKDAEGFIEVTMTVRVLKSKSVAQAR